MRLEHSLSERMSLDMRLAPRMIQSMEILQMPVMELQERINQELQENPVLELVREQDGETLDRETLRDLRRDDDIGVLKMDPVGGEADFQRLDVAFESEVGRRAYRAVDEVAVGVRIGLARGDEPELHVFGDFRVVR